MKLLFPALITVVFAGATLPLALAQRGSSLAENAATEDELLAAVRDIEQLASTLQVGLKKYREHLQVAMDKQGYGLYHPLFRTSLNGFEQDQIDLDDLDEYKMGRFAFDLTSSGTRLQPNPFDDWVEVQTALASFQARLSNARIVVARSDIIAARTAQNIPQDQWKKLRKRWRSASGQASDLYGHAIAVRAIRFEDGEMVPAPATVRRIFDGGRYALICAFGVCTSQPAATDSETRQNPPQ